MSGDKILKIRLIGNAKGAVGAIEETEAASATLGKRMEKLSKRIGKVGKTLKDAGHTLTHRVTIPVALAGAASIKMATDFDTAMLKIQTQAGASARDVETLKKQVLDLAGKTQQSPLELANAMYHLKSVGMDNADAMRALAQATKLASISGADMEETTNALAGAWRTGIKGSSKFSGVVAKLNAIVGAGNMRMSDLNDALGTGFLASAKGFGLGLKDVGAALAVMTDEAVPANAAATRLRMAFSLLGAPSKAAEKQLEKIGLTGKKLATRMRKGGIVGAIGLLKDHLKSLSKVDASQVISRAFGGGRSSAAIQTLINNFDVLELKEKQVTKGAGRFGASVAKQMKSPKAQFKLLISTIEVLAVKIGNKLLPFAVKAAQAFNKFLTWFDKLPGPVKKTAAAFVGMLAVAGPLLTIVGGMAAGLAALLTPAGAIVAVIVGLAAGFAILWNRSKSFRNIIKDLAGKLKASVMPAFSTIADIVQTQIIPAFKTVAPVLAFVGKLLLKIFGGALIGVITGAIQFIKGFVQVIGGVFALVADLIHGRWKQAWHDLLQILKGILNMVIGAFKVWWNVGILSVFRHGIAAVLGFFKGGFKRLLGVAEGGIGGIGKVITKVYRFITAPFRKAFSWVLHYVRWGWRYIRGNFYKGIGRVKSVMHRIIEVVTWPYKAAFRLARRVVVGGIRAVVGFFRRMPGRIMSAIRRIPRMVRGVFRGAGSWLWHAGADIIRGLIGGINSLIHIVSDKLHWLTNMIPDWKGPPKKDKVLLRPAGQMIMGGFMDGLASRFGHVRNMLGGFTRNLASAASGSVLTPSGALRAGSPAGGYIRGSAGGPAVLVHVTVEGNVIGEKDFAKRVTPTVRDELSKIGRRNGGRIFD